MVRIASTLAVAASTLAIVAAHEGHNHGSGSSANMTADGVQAGACAANVSASVIAVVENVTFFDTCAKGSTFKFTSLLDALKLPATDFFQFCNSSACLGPMHTVMHDAPLTCLITYQGKAQNLTGEITELHDKCHAVKDAAKAAASKNSSSSNSSSKSIAATPAPSTTGAASVSSKSLAAAIASCAVVVSLLL